jgi:peptidylprolyl isomerase
VAEAKPIEILEVPQLVLPGAIGIVQSGGRAEHGFGPLIQAQVARMKPQVFLERAELAFAFLPAGCDRDDRPLKAGVRERIAEVGCAELRTQQQDIVHMQILAEAVRAGYYPSAIDNQANLAMTRALPAHLTGSRRVPRPARTLCRLVAGALTTTGLAASAAEPPQPAGRTMADVLAASVPGDWRVPDPAHTLYLEFDEGRVIIELAPAFAPEHATNVLRLAQAGYYDGLAIVRVQDNFVVQWGGGEGRSLPAGARATLPPEFTVSITPSLPFTVLPDADGYAPQVGFSAGFPAARDPSTGQAWLAHCYAMVGAGRDNPVESGNGAEIYVVIGHAPRQLDRNIALVGRVLAGMELLAALPRGPAPMGFHQEPSRQVPIRRVRVAADLPEPERTRLEVLRTDTATFTALVEARRNRRDEWYKRPAQYIDLCNVPIPVRSR